MRDTKYEASGGDTKQLVESAKLILGITGNESDGLLEFYVQDTISAILSYCRLELFPRQLEGFAASIAAKRFGEGDSGVVKSVTEGERRVEYRDEEYDFLAAYASRLKPFVSRAACVPSEMDGDADA